MSAAEHLDTNPLRDAALAYAARGWLVFPAHSITSSGQCSCLNDCGDSAAKHPRVFWKREATTDADTIRAWWAKWTDANVGVATGAASGLFVFDVETHKGGGQSLIAIEKRFGKLPITPTVRTGGGGWHYYLAHPGGEITNSSAFAGYTGIDTRGDGGYVIAPPSNHKSGGVYRWLDSQPFDLALAPVPAWLLDLDSKRKPSGAKLDFDPQGWDGDEPEWLAAVLDSYPEIARRFERDTTGLTDTSSSSVDMSLASLAAIRAGLTGEQLELLIHVSRSRAGISSEGESYYRHTVGKALAGAQAREQAKTEQAEQPIAPSDGDPRRFFGEGGLVVPRLGEELHVLGHVALGIDGRLYQYASGVYRGDGDAFVRSTSRRLLGDLFKRRHTDEVTAYLRAAFATVTDRQPEGLLNLADGLLEWNAENKPTLHDHAPEIISTVQIPHPWNPQATCPRILAFLEGVVPDGVSFMLEVIGYALLPANPLRVAVLLLGPGCNGKSVLLAVIKALIGSENVSAVPLQLLAEHRFAAAELFGRLANICGDLDARAIKQTDTFKMLTGGDALMAERKHRDPFTFVPFALPIFSANEPPLSSDQTEAWFDRWLVVPMPRRIPDDEIDPHLVAKLTTPAELQGLLVIAVEGLRRAMRRGRFELPESVKAGRLAYRERLDTVAGFVAECCELAPSAWTPRPALYRAYRRWATEGGRLPVSSATFNDHLRGGFAGKLHEIKRVGTWGWEGIFHGADL